MAPLLHTRPFCLAACHWRQACVATLLLVAGALAPVQSGLASSSLQHQTASPAAPQQLLDGAARVLQAVLGPNTQSLLRGLIAKAAPASARVRTACQALGSLALAPSRQLRAPAAPGAPSQIEFGQARVDYSLTGRATSLSDRAHPRGPALSLAGSKLVFTHGEQWRATFFARHLFGKAGRAQRPGAIPPVQPNPLRQSAPRARTLGLTVDYHY